MVGRFYESRIEMYAKYVKFMAVPTIFIKGMSDLSKHARLRVLKVMSAFSECLDAIFSAFADKEAPRIHSASINLSSLYYLLGNY